MAQVLFFLLSLTANYNAIAGFISEGFRFGWMTSLLLLGLVFAYSIAVLCKRRFFPEQP